MAESTLSISYAEIRREVAHTLGWNRDATTWSTEQAEDFADIVKRGLRLFYWPPAAAGEPRHEWSFLRPTTTLALSGSDWDYDLPDNCSGVVVPESVVFQLGSTKRRLRKVRPDEITALQGLDSQSGTPFYFAVRAKAHAPTTGLRYEIILYPTPSGSMTLVYQYVVQPDTIDGTNQYPYGGAAYSETILAAILAAAEAKIDDDPNGPYRQQFMSILGNSIRLDREMKESQE